MNRFSIFFGVFILLLSFTECQYFEHSNLSANYMALDSVVYIDKFPLSIEIDNEEPVDLEIIGMKNFIIYDSLLIAYTSNKEGFWSFYSINNYNHIGDYLKRGNGPFEFTEMINVTEATFYKKNNNLCAGIYDFNRGHVYEMNINESLKNEELSISLINDSIPATLFNFAMIDSVTYFCKMINDDITQQIRYILKNGNKVTPNNFNSLNKAHIDFNEDINILSTIMQINREKGLVVEIPIGLNQINLYSINNDFGKTVCVGNQLDDIEKIQDKLRWNRTYTYGNLRIYDNFFAALCINEKEKTYQTKRSVLPIIQFFNWEGLPLLSLKLNDHITGFDIDFGNGYLYTFDQKTDRFSKYDIKHILKRIKVNV